MLKIPFWKLQSVGNDFPLVHIDDIRNALAFRAVERLAAAPQTDPPQAPAEAQPTPPTDEVTGFLSELSIAICDRRFGVGGDGLLAIEMEGEALRLRMFNPDGTEDFCGNGIRCAVVHAHAVGWVGTSFTVLHLDREVPAEIGDGRVRTTLGTADYHPERVPTKAYGELFNTTVWSGIDAGQPLSLFGSALTTGSTHTIIPTSSLPDDDSFLAVSPRIETDPMFPDRTSVIWSQEVAPDHLKIRIWERGVGETLGCGTGATAATADYLRRKNRGGAVTVESKGGSLKISAASWFEPLTIEGVAEQVYKGEYRFSD
ncbi:MAG: diaminopimelate epimerase [Fimbriimonas sp.]